MYNTIFQADCVTIGTAAREIKIREIKDEVISIVSDSALVLAFENQLLEL